MIAPREYRDRFREAMTRNFTAAPGIFTLCRSGDLRHDPAESRSDSVRKCQSVHATGFLVLQLTVKTLRWMRLTTKSMIKVFMTSQVCWIKHKP